MPSLRLWGKKMLLWLPLKLQPAALPASLPCLLPPPYRPTNRNPGKCGVYASQTFFTWARYVTSIDSSRTVLNVIEIILFCNCFVPCPSPRLFYSGFLESLSGKLQHFDEGPAFTLICSSVFRVLFSHYKELLPYISAHIYDKLLPKRSRE